MRAPADVPIELDREDAARQAALELANPAYRTAQPSWLERIVGWLLEQLDEWTSAASQAAPGGWWGVLGLVVVVTAGAILIRWRVGPVARSAALETIADPSISAAQYRAQAADDAAAGRWDAAVAARMAAISRAAEERGLAAARPGRTADELAAELAESVPNAGPALARAAQVFDRVRYGHYRAGNVEYQHLVTADETLATAPARPPAGALAANPVAP